MNATATGYPAGDFRVSDADRDRALSELSEAFQAGRITTGEFHQRSGQALSARTGAELTAVLADLPLDRAGGAPAASAAAARPAARVIAARIAMGASAVAATALTAAAATNLFSHAHAATLQQREFARQVAQQALARQGIRVSVPLPPASSAGFDWAGTVTPLVFAVLLVALIIWVWKR